MLLSLQCAYKGWSPNHFTTSSQLLNSESLFSLKWTHESNIKHTSGHFTSHFFFAIQDNSGSIWNYFFLKWTVLNCWLFYQSGLLSDHIFLYLLLDSITASSYRRCPHKNEGIKKVLMYTINKGFSLTSCLTVKDTFSWEICNSKWEKPSAYNDLSDYTI